MEAMNKVETVAQMFYEDVPMLMLYTLIGFGVLQCPEIESEPVV